MGVKTAYTSARMPRLKVRPSRGADPWGQGDTGLSLGSTSSTAPTIHVHCGCRHTGLRRYVASVDTYFTPFPYVRHRVSYMAVRRGSASPTPERLLDCRQSANRARSPQANDRHSEGEHHEQVNPNHPP